MALPLGLAEGGVVTSELSQTYTTLSSGTTDHWRTERDRDNLPVGVSQCSHHSISAP